jgi:hypothetical protein
MMRKERGTYLIWTIPRIFTGVNVAANVTPDVLSMFA